MRLPPAILGNTEEVLREILRFSAPADTTLSRYFKDHPRLGSRERGAVAGGVGHERGQMGELRGGAGVFAARLERVEMRGGHQFSQRLRRR